MTDFLRLPGALPTLILCSLLGGLILTRFTRVPGVVGFVLNTLILFCGGMVSNVIANGVRVPLESALQKTVFVTLGGMMVTSLVTLAFLARDRR